MRTSVTQVFEEGTQHRAAQGELHVDTSDAAALLLPDSLWDVPIVGDFDLRQRLDFEVITLVGEGDIEPVLEHAKTEFVKGHRAHHGNRSAPFRSPSQIRVVQPGASSLTVQKSMPS